ncbi:arginase family protein [Bradyrhizobium sp. RDI18]|uniref:arginase family protein n=1 Tax=Bradyrhizobium sp. RDI18 TaxID=3367400 RepID=UPI0037193DA4
MRHIDGSAALRNAGILNLLETQEFDVMDHGDLSVSGIIGLKDLPPENARHYRNQRWTRPAQQARITGALPIFLGSDHSLSMGSINAMSRNWQERGR